MNDTHRTTIILLIVVCFSVLFFKLAIWKDGLEGLLPQRHHMFTLSMAFDGSGEDVFLKALLPMTNERQMITEEIYGASGMQFNIQQDQGGRNGVWSKSNVSGRHAFQYSCTIWTKALKFAMTDTIDIPGQIPDRFGQYLFAQEKIQSDAPEITELYEQLVAAADRNNAAAIVRAVFDYTAYTIKPADFQGETDALTTLRLQEGSCGGKSRLFVSLCRAGGIPARLVGGLMLREGVWRSSHIWAEARLGDQWVPFCPLNDYYAELPAHYLILYYRDLPLFQYTRDINFSYSFYSRAIMAPPHNAATGTDLKSRTSLWHVFEQLHIPVDLLRIILMIPVGALVVVVARNIIGMHTFGTFMPALMAVAFRDTGLVWGLSLFLGVLLFVGLMRYGLNHLQLLHTPKLALLMTGTVAFMICVVLFSATEGNRHAARITAFPIVILTLTVERFAIMWEEEGAGYSIRVVIGTMIVVAAAYLAMNWDILQKLILAFPELLLLLGAVFIGIGRWTGLRLSEYLRFREILFRRSGRNAKHDFESGASTA